MCFCITEPVWEIVLCCGLILYSVSERVCMFVCVPVRELEIELCNKRCAFPDRIAETLTSSTALPPKKTRLMLLKMQSFLQEEDFTKQNALDYYNPTDGDHEDKWQLL